MLVKIRVIDIHHMLLTFNIYLTEKKRLAQIGVVLNKRLINCRLSAFGYMLSVDKFWHI